MADPRTAEDVVNEATYLERLAKAGVPDHLQAGLVRYLVQRIPTGAFLAAVLANDLAEAVTRAADDEARARLINLVQFLYQDAPPACWGSPQKVTAWLEGRSAV